MEFIINVCWRKLEFVDLYDHNIKNSKEIQYNERLVLFLERPYYAGLPSNKESQAMELVFRLMRKKAEMLEALLVLSENYQRWKPLGFVRSEFFMYISKSKAGAQYLDSLKGSRCVGDEGGYEKYQFLIPVNSCLQER